MSYLKSLSFILTLLGLVVLPRLLFAQTPDTKPLLAPEATSLAPKPTNVLPGIFCTQEYDPVCGVDNRTYSNACMAEKVFGVAIKHKGACEETNDSPKPVPASFPTAEKCGLKIYRAINQCGVAAFKGAYIQCYDGYEETLGGESSCKPSNVWVKYGQEICANRYKVMSIAPEPISPGQKSKPIELPPLPPQTQVKPVPICYIPDKLTKDYNRLILELRKAEEAGNKELVNTIMQKITALKLEIEKARKECLTNPTPEPVPKRCRPRPACLDTTPKCLLPEPAEGWCPVARPAPVPINRCAEVSQWGNKIAYYQKLAGLSDNELKETSGFSREEVEKILAELPQGLVKVKAQCDTQETVASDRATEAVKKIIAMPVKPVVVESGAEIEEYYKAKIENITAEGDTEEQLAKLKSLKTEIDELTAKLIRGRKEIEAAEFSNVASEVRISSGEIKADNAVVKTTDKKILINVGKKPLSIVPTAKQVIINDENLKVAVKEVFIKENALLVGNSEVKMAASEVAENLDISPKEVKLEEKDGRAVYSFKVLESRKLFGFIPIRVTKTLTADAESSNLLQERLPWWWFLTTG